MLKGKTVVLGVTGSIAAYKIANLASMLSKLHADIHVLMTQNATNFINPITFETLTGNKCLIDTFDRNFQFNVEHVSLAKKADVVLIAPASANVIGKLANGIADDMLTTTVMACKCKKIISPAMNTNMYENPIVQDNIAKLKRFGMQVIEPDVGLLACKDVGAGKMPSEDTLLDFILQEILCTCDSRTYNGSNRPGEIYLKSFNRKNGLCSGKNSRKTRSESNTCKRTCKSFTATICRNCADRKCRPDV